VKGEKCIPIASPTKQPEKKNSKHIKHVFYPKVQYFNNNHKKGKVKAYVEKEEKR